MRKLDAAPCAQQQQAVEWIMTGGSDAKRLLKEHEQARWPGAGARRAADGPNRTEDEQAEQRLRLAMEMRAAEEQARRKRTEGARRERRREAADWPQPARPDQEGAAVRTRRGALAALWKDRALRGRSSAGVPVSVKTAPPPTKAGRELEPLLE